MIGADWLAEQHGQEPITVYLPTERVIEGDSEITVQLVRLPDGRTVLPAFTSLDALVGTLGGQQPWIATPQDRVPEVQQQSSADDVLWDPPLPDELRGEVSR